MKRNLWLITYVTCRYSYSTLRRKRCVILVLVILNCINKSQNYYNLISTYANKFNEK